LTNGLPERAEAEKALQEVGLPAVPYLVAVFGKTDSLYSKLWNKLPAITRRFLPEPFPWPIIRSQAAEVLGSIGARHRFSDGIGDARTTPQLRHVVRVLAQHLTDPDVHLRIAYAQALAFIGPNARDAVPDLIKMFEQGNAQEKVFVCQAFGAIGSCPSAGQAVQTMLASLNATDKHLEGALVSALGGIGSEAEKAIPALVERLTDTDGQMRRAAVRSLARIGNLPPTMRPKLLPLINETDEGTRAGAAVALLRLDLTDSNALTVVRHCLSSTNPANLPTSTLYLMVNMGPAARSFLPELQGFVKASGPESAFARKVLKTSTNSPPKVRTY
jgi:HEAT repeat protein